MHLGCQGSPSEDPFLRCPALRGRRAAVQQGCARGGQSYHASNRMHNPTNLVPLLPLADLSGTSPRRVE